MELHPCPMLPITDHWVEEKIEKGFMKGFGYYQL